MNIVSKIINKIFGFYNILYAVIYKKYFFKMQLISQLENNKFIKEEIEFNQSEAILNKILQEKYKRNFNREKDSIHWLLFSALSKKQYVKKILEIGTYDGEFTYILSRLFNKSHITTVDLPFDDPLLKKFYDRDKSNYLSAYLEKQSRNISIDNITMIKSNSFYLLDALEEKEKFDLIWVDGGHLYPEVAWDLCNAYFLLRKGGILLCDDVIMSEKYYRSNYVSTESWEVLKYIQERTNNEITYFLKRLDPIKYAREHSRKYVAMLTK